jgi:hypothetical protein
MHKVEQNCTKKKEPTKCPKFKCNTVSVSFSACRCSSVVFSSKVRREKKKKEPGDSSVNGICGCGLPAHCYQPAVAGGVIYADFRGELSTHLALQALFTQISPLHEPLLQAFPFPSTLGEVTLHPLSQACLFVYSSHGKWVFPPLLCSLPPTDTFTSFPTPDYWTVLLLLPTSMFVYSSCGKWVFPPLSCGVFLPLPLSHAFPLLIGGCVFLLPPEPF